MNVTRMMSLVVVLGMFTCTPAQRPWVFPVSGGPFTAPADRTLRLVIEGNFPAKTLHVSGQDRLGLHRELAVIALPGQQYEVTIPPSVTVKAITLFDSCSGWLASCEMPAGITARVVSAEPSAFWMATVDVPSTKVTLLRPGGYAHFTIAVGAVRLPLVDLVLDSDERAFTSEIENVWLDSPGHYRASVLFRNVSTGPVTFAWKARVSVVGSCHGIAATETRCDAPTGSSPVVERTSEGCCRDDAERSGAELACKGKHGEVKRIGPADIAYCDRIVEGAGQACASSANCIGWCMPAATGGVCSQTAVRPPCFASYERGVVFKSCD